MADADFDELLELAHDKTRRGRYALIETIAELFESRGATMSDRERSLMVDILNKLIREVERQIRHELSRRLADRPEIPREVALLLANDQIEVARPILLASEVLQDRDLIEIIRHRTMQHQLSIAMRREVSEEVSDALVAAGHIDVIRALLDNPNAQLSEATMAYLVEESRRVDTYQEPLVRRVDLPPSLARRMCLWVGAALRSYILANHEIDPTELDDLLEEVIRESGGSTFAAADEPLPDASNKLAQLFHQDQPITPELLVRLLRQGEISLFEALLAELAGLRTRLVRRVIYEPGGEGLVIIARALDIAKPAFTSIFLMSRKGRPGEQIVDPEELPRVLSLYDRVRPEAAMAVLRRWRRDPDYLDAIRRIEATRRRETPSQ